MPPIQIHTTACYICSAPGVQNKGDSRLQCRLISCMSCELYLKVTAEYRVDKLGNQVRPAECEALAEGEGGQSRGCTRYVHKLADICKRSGCSNSFHPSCCGRPGKPSYGVEWKNYISATVEDGRTVLTPIEHLRLKLQYLLCPECFARIPASHKQSDFCEGTEREVAAREHRRRQQMESQLKQRKMTRAVQRSARYGKPLGLVGVSKAGNPYRVLPPVADAHTAQLFCDATAQLVGLIADKLAGDSGKAGDDRAAVEKAAQRLGMEGPGAADGSQEA